MCELYQNLIMRSVREIETLERHGHLNDRMVAAVMVFDTPLSPIRPKLRAIRNETVFLSAINGTESTDNEEEDDEDSDATIKLDDGDDDDIEPPEKQTRNAKVTFKQQHQYMPPTVVAALNGTFVRISPGFARSRGLPTASRFTNHAVPRMRTDGKKN